LKIKNVQKFKVGDTARISKIKGLFEKGYLPNWSEEIYTVGAVKNMVPFTYILKDTHDEIIARSFYNEELQKTAQKVFRIDKVLRKKKINGAQHVSLNGWATTKNVTNGCQ